jgi:hypothetical protein
MFLHALSLSYCHVCLFLSYTYKEVLSLGILCFHDFIMQNIQVYLDLLTCMVKEYSNLIFVECVLFKVYIYSYIYIDNALMETNLPRIEGSPL